LFAKAEKQKACHREAVWGFLLYLPLLDRPLAIRFFAALQIGLS